MSGKEKGRRYPTFVMYENLSTALSLPLERWKMKDNMLTRAAPVKEVNLLWYLSARGRSKLNVVAKGNKSNAEGPQRLQRECRSEVIEDLKPQL